MNKKILFLYLLMFLLLTSNLPGSEYTILDQYLQLGIKNNLSLKQRDIDLKKSLAALREARGMFLPAITLMARYTRAGGGRLIEVPVGDMLNPVYSSLNSLYSLHDLPANFPTNLPNEYIPFLREEEQDTRLRLVQPLFEPAILYNYKIKKKLSQISRLQLRYYRRQLVMEIKKAYFNYLKAARGKQILLEIRKLLTEGLRVSESLFKNGKATRDVIFRGEAEISNLNQRIIQAENLRKVTASYFNFLLNRPLTAKIREMGQIRLKFLLPDYEISRKNALSNREELELLKHQIKAAGFLIELNRGSYLPDVMAVVDYGFQGIHYSFTSRDDYWSASLVLNWKLFNGFKDTHKIRQEILERKKLELKLQALISQIQLQTRRAYDELKSSRASIQFARDRVRSLEKSFDIILKKYKNGMASQLEYLDAQTNLTSARIDLSIKKYDYLISWADFEFVSAFKEDQELPVETNNPRKGEGQDEK